MVVAFVTYLLSAGLSLDKPEVCNPNYRTDDQRTIWNQFQEVLALQQQIV